MVAEEEQTQPQEEAEVNTLAEDIRKVRETTEARIAEIHARALRRQALTADGTPPEGCGNNLCDGHVIFEDKLIACPLARTACPFLSGREKQLRHRILSGLGFGARYLDPDLARVPADIAEEVQGYLANLSRNIRQGRGLLVSGSVGAGKTSLLALIAYHAELAGFSVAQWYAPSLFDALHNREPGLYGDTAVMDLLCIDDFGVQYAGEWGASRFDALMEERYCQCKAVCVTTNVPLLKLGESGQWVRVVDRWREMCAGLETKAQSQRRTSERGAD